MEVHRLVIYVVDHDQLGAEGVKQELESTNYANDCIAPEVLSVETADIGEWSDENPLNFNETACEEITRLFDA